MIDTRTPLLLTLVVIYGHSSSSGARHIYCSNTATVSIQHGCLPLLCSDLTAPAVVTRSGSVCMYNKQRGRIRSHKIYMRFTCICMLTCACMYSEHVLSVYHKLFYWVFACVCTICYMYMFSTCISTLVYYINIFFRVYFLYLLLPSGRRVSGIFIWYYQQNVTIATHQIVNFRQLDSNSVFLPLAERCQQHLKEVGSVF